MKKIAFLFIVLISLLFFLLFFKKDNSYTKYSKKESCIECHSDTKSGFSQFHLPENIGCAACHLGNVYAQNKDSAHIGIVKIPGNLSDADKTCGICHANQLHNIKHSLMTTNSGLIAVDKYFFKDSDSLNAYFHIKELGYDASDTHLRNLCASCHLGAEKTEYGEITEESRGGGCNACHLNYAKDKNHPSTDIQITNTHCFGCHSRSSRISTNYMGYSETLNEKNLKDKTLKKFEDGRTYQYNDADVHHKAGMLCIDCHGSKEVMGHGVDYAHQEDAVKIQCKDCHFEKNKTTTSFKELDSEEKMLFFLRDFTHKEKEIIKTKKENFALINTFLENDEAYLISKKDGKKFKIPKPIAACTKPAHENLNCSTCHTSWTSKCIGCHNTYNREAYMTGYDLLAKETVDESWNEMITEFSVSESTFGVKEENGEREIQTAMPGMIMTIDHQSFDSSATIHESFYRLYAPTVPHTISKEVRTCKSCHNNPYALGYGAGKLWFEKNQWFFDADYEKNIHDNLPEDSWISMFEEFDKNKEYSTRTNFRPFDINEQKVILEVGKCLQCHKENSQVMKNSLEIGIIEISKLKNKNTCL